VVTSWPVPGQNGVGLEMLTIPASFLPASANCGHSYVRSPSTAHDRDLSVAERLKTLSMVSLHERSDPWIPSSYGGDGDACVSDRVGRTRPSRYSERRVDGRILLFAMKWLLAKWPSLSRSTFVTQRSMEVIVASHLAARCRALFDAPKSGYVLRSARYWGPGL